MVRLRSQGRQVAPKVKSGDNSFARLLELGDQTSMRCEVPTKTGVDHGKTQEGIEGTKASKTAKGKLSQTR
jgi:hypothetical protein